jgi:hypothetical protein
MDRNKSSLENIDQFLSKFSIFFTKNRKFEFKMPHFVYEFTK